jgi:hypothetical protein
VIAKLSPHRIIETARDGVSVISTQEFATAEAARDEFDRLVRVYAKSGLYAQLYMDGVFRVSVSAGAVNE